MRNVVALWFTVIPDNYTWHAEHRNISEFLGTMFWRIRSRHCLELHDSCFLWSLWNIWAKWFGHQRSSGECLEKSCNMTMKRQLFDKCTVWYFVLYHNHLMHKLTTDLCLCLIKTLSFFRCHTSRFLSSACLLPRCRLARGWARVSWSSCSHCELPVCMNDSDCYLLKPGLLREFLLCSAPAPPAKSPPGGGEVVGWRIRNAERGREQIAEKKSVGLWNYFWKRSNAAFTL